MIARDYHGV